MAIPLDPKQAVSLEELLMSQVVQQEALTRLLVEKGIITKEEFFGDGEGGRSGDGQEKKEGGGLNEIMHKKCCTYSVSLTSFEWMHHPSSSQIV